MADVEKLVILLEAQSLKLQNELVRTNRLIDRFAAQTEKRFDLMQRKNAASFAQLNRSVQTSMGALNRAIAPVIGTLGVREVANYADEWISAGNKIAAAAQVAGLQARSLDALKDSANDARTAFSDYIDLYARLLRSSAAVGATELEVARVTDVVAKSLKAGGASAQEQTAALIQLGQALASGNLQGDELRSIRENAPLVAQAIADEFGVTIGQLKALGAEGKLTSDRVFKALLSGADNIEAAFKETRSTIKDAFQRIENEFIAYVGNADKSTGATRGLIDALNFLADNFRQVADVIVPFVAILTAAFAGQAIVGGIGAATLALGAFLSAMSAGTLTALTFSAALGPIGFILGATAAAIGLLVYASGDAARAAKAHTEALQANSQKLELAKDSSDSFRKELQKQIAMQLKAAEAALTEAKAQVEAAKARAELATGLSNTFSPVNDMFFGPDYDPSKSAEGAFVDPAKDKVRLLEQRLADYQRQLKEIDALRTTPEGTADDPNGSGSGGSGSGSKADDYAKAMKAMRQRTADIQAETTAQAALNPLVNDYGFALEKARAKQDLLNAATEAGIALSPEVRAAIDAAATAYTQATVEADKLAEAQGKAVESARGWADLGKSALKGFISDLKAGKSAAEALGGVFDKLADKFLDIGLDAIFGTGGKDFGIIGSLFGFAKGGIAAHGRPQPLPRFAGGGVSNSASIFGEAGPEAAVPLPDGRRIPVDLRMPTKGGGGGGSLQVNVAVGVQNGELVPLIAQVSGEVSGRQIDQRVPAIVKQVAPGAVKIANYNRT